MEFLIFIAVCLILLDGYKVRQNTSKVIEQNELMIQLLKEKQSDLKDNKINIKTTELQ